ncbi:hypothetical protein MKW98_024436 [Papaver atlanticum]|uniref:Uncharacterized protein n=1 Tax=Papaver atlanticum TaxID=357466 RepID=A0AAD4XLM4_9MAGN|nr:hypothetical protein MKW98_024436 [Papaver atlanticum]
MGKQYRTLEIMQISPNPSVFHLFLNNPSLRNALSVDFYSELPKALTSLDQNPDVNVIILSGYGDHFCSGVDLKSFDSLMMKSQSYAQGRLRERLRREIKSFQDATTAIERCRKPVIAAIHGSCIAGGIDLITACDIRYCTKDAFFCVKEVDLAMNGAFLRLPSIVGYSNAIELALTARKFLGPEAKDLGLVSKVFQSKSALDEGVNAAAEGIAMRSLLAMIGTKESQPKSQRGNRPSPSSEFSYHCRGYTNASSISPVSRELPPSGVVKVNVDAAFNNGNAAAAAVAVDSYGNHLGSGSVCFNTISSNSCRG